MFDYILTGPISGVSAGQYIVGLVAQTATYFGHPWSPSPEVINLYAAGLGALVTIYFWRRNTKGIYESSDDALKIMYVTTVMVVLLIGWSGVTILRKPETQRLPPAPVVSNLVFNEDAVGWMPRLIPHWLREAPGDETLAIDQKRSATTAPPHYRFATNAGALLGLIGILMAFGHSFLAMSGEESLAQVNRELEYPKHANLMKAGMVIFIYSLLFTSLVSFFAYALIPDAVRPQYFNNLISGISMYLVGPMPLKLLFQGFIVIVGFLMLAGAINTSIIGSNGVLNRVSEDGVMTDWFSAPHSKYGTTYRMINLIVILQLVAIVGSRGNTYTLGEAYAFGVIWSFAFKGLAMLVLRFKDTSHREWKVPFNLHVGGTDIPIGLGVIAAILFSIAGINLITKQVATVSGVAFTLVFFIVFVVSEHMNERKRGADAHVEMDQFRLQPQDVISTETVEIRPGSALCVVRDYNTLDHVKIALELTHTGKRDLVVMTVQVMKGPDAGYEDIAENQLFTRYEQLLFSRVTAVAEKAGKHVDLLVVPGTNVFDAIAQTAAHLDVADIWACRSSVMATEEQARYVGDAWERLPKKPSRRVTIHVVESNGAVDDFTLGAHAPTLANADIDLIHNLWMDATKNGGVEDLHHREIVTVALARLAEELRGPERPATLERIGRMLGKRIGTASTPDGQT